MTKSSQPKSKHIVLLKPFVHKDFSSPFVDDLPETISRFPTPFSLLLNGNCLCRKHLPIV